MRHRLAALERKIGGRDPCPTCSESIRIRWPESLGDDDQDDGHEGHERQVVGHWPCGTCGRPVEVAVWWPPVAE